MGGRSPQMSHIEMSRDMLVIIRKVKNTVVFLLLVMKLKCQVCQLLFLLLIVMTQNFGTELMSKQCRP